MHGPVWNDPNVGVTGETRNFRNTEPNYVTTQQEGRTVTYVGDKAEQFRLNHLHG